MSSIATIRRYIEDPNGVIYPDAYIYDCMNEVVLDLHSENKPTLAYDGLYLNTDDDIVFMPSTIMIPQRVIYTNKPYYVTTQAELERHSRFWRTTEKSQPKWFIRYDHNRLRVWPRPDTTYNMTIIGVGWPVEISATNLEPDIYASYTDAIEHKVSATLLELSRPDLAAIHNQEYKECSYAFRVSQRNIQGHNIRRLQPATKNNMAQAGSIFVGSQFS